MTRTGVVQTPDDGRLVPANVATLKKLVEEEDWEAAQDMMRRIWRTYPSDNNPYGRVIYYGPSRGGLMWPVDRVQQDEEELSEEEKAERQAEAAERRRGGMLAYREQVAQSPERRDGYEVLAQYDFAVDEMRRRLRANGPSQLESMAPVINGLAQARVREQGLQPAIDELIALAVEGSARKTELLQLLALLEQHPDAIGSEARAVLDDLERSLHPRDGAQLLRLARVMAASGARERAIDIYRWCATQTTASRYFSSRQDDLGSIQLQLLVEEVRETLGQGEDMVGVIEDVLRYSSPVQYPWEREQHQILMLETWAELLDPAEAVARCEEILAEADSREQSLRRNVADRAALMYARAGNVVRGIDCLEAALCSFEAGAFNEEQNFWAGNYRKRPFSTAQYRRFLDSGMTDWGAPAEWSVALGNALLDWAEAGRLALDDALRGAALAAVRAQENGDAAAAKALVERAAALRGSEAEAALWVADAARVSGDTLLADSIERELLEARGLNVHRVGDVARRVFEEEGAAATLALGEALRDWTTHSDLMAVLEEAAQASADAELIDAIAARTAEVEAAQARIAAWRAEERRKAEEAREARESQAGR